MSKLVIVLFVMLCLNCVHSEFNFIVARDRSGQFNQISEAIEAVPINNKNRFTIKVKAGVYNSFVVPKDKPNISLFGDGIDLTVVSGSKSNGTGFTLSETATVQIYGADFVAQGIAFINTAGPSMGQAVAILVDSEHAVFYQCKITGYQDTLYMKSGSQFYRECKIYGTIDFIFGDPRVVLQDSEIILHQPLHGQANVITAENRNNPNIELGIVLHHCTIKAAPDFQPHSVETFLGRPWGNYSATIVMQSYLPDFIDPRGWTDWDDRTLYRRDLVSYREYNNRGPGAMTGKRVNWPGFTVMRNISEAQKYTVRNFLNGNAWLPSTNVPFNPDLYP